MSQRNFYFITSSHPGRGTTLIEVMISLTLSFFLLGLVTAIYWATERHNERLTALTRLHAHSHFVLQKLAMEIQAAGFIGCPRLTADFPLGSTIGASLTVANKLELTPAAEGGTEVTVRHRSLKAAALGAPMMQSSVLEIASSLPVSSGDWLLISDCRHAELFQVAEVRSGGDWQRLTALRPLQYRYAENAEVGELEITRYAVEKTGRRDEVGQSLFALYRTDQRGHKTELVTGIQQLKVAEQAAGRAVTLAIQASQAGFSKTEYGFVALRN